MKIVDVISFENISVLDQQILPFPLIKVSMKQLALLIVTMLIAYSIAKVNIILAIIIATPFLLLTFYKYRSMSFDLLLISMIRYYMRVRLDNINKLFKDDKPFKKIESDKLYNVKLFKKKRDQLLAPTSEKKTSEEEILPKYSKPFIEPIKREEQLYYLTPNCSNLQLELKGNTLTVGDSNIILNADIHKVVIEVDKQTITRLIVT
ncbi:MAG: PrgI family protein [Candidatus Nitrosocaldaceae archaeon]